MTVLKTATYSIIAYDAAADRFGAATASCVLGVAGRVQFYRPETGIVCTQHCDSAVIANKILSAMESGAVPERAIGAALQDDPAAAERQLLAGDFARRFAVHTGTACTLRHAFAHSECALAAGNTLSSDDVPAQMLEAFEQAQGKSLTHRLIAALQKGMDLKGDSRGIQSAGLISVPRRIHGWESQVVNLRADFHEDPVSELRALYGIFCKRFGSQ